MSTSTSTNPSKPTEKAKEESQPEFERLNQTVYLSKPDPKARTKSNSTGISSDVVPPRIVLLFGWMDAPFRIVEKYALPYRARFPQSHILIKLSRGDHYFQGKGQQLKALDSLVDYLEKEGKREEARKLLNAESSKLELKSKDVILDKDTVSKLEKERLKESTVTLIEKSELEEGGGEEKKSEEPQSPYGFIIHSFSDGGAGNQSQFIAKTNLKQTSIFPKLRAQIFDCSVGSTSPQSGSTAFSLPLLKKSKLLFYTFKSFLYVFLSMVLFIKRIIGRPTRSDLLRKALNNIANYHSLLKNSTSEIHRNKLSHLKLPPRLYLYSKNDVLIDWRDVESHANDLAVDQGLTRPLLIEMEKRNKDEKENGKDDEKFARGFLELRRWDTPNHCDIGRADFDGYWKGGVDEFLSKALKDW